MTWFVPIVIALGRILVDNRPESSYRYRKGRVELSSRNDATEEIAERLNDARDSGTLVDDPHEWPPDAVLDRSIVEDRLSRVRGFLELCQPGIDDEMRANLLNKEREYETQLQELGGDPSKVGATVV